MVRRRYPNRKVPFIPGTCPLVRSPTPKEVLDETVEDLLGEPGSPISASQEEELLREESPATSELACQLQNFNLRESSLPTIPEEMEEETEEPSSPPPHYNNNHFQPPRDHYKIERVLRDPRGATTTTTTPTVAASTSAIPPLMSIPILRPPTFKKRITPRNFHFKLPNPYQNQSRRIPKSRIYTRRLPSGEIEPICFTCGEPGHIHTSPICPLKK